MSLANESIQHVDETVAAANPQLSISEQLSIRTTRISSRPSPVYHLNTNSSSSNSRSKAGATNSNFSYSTLSSYSPLTDNSIPSRPVIQNLSQALNRLKKEDYSSSSVSFEARKDHKSALKNVASFIFGVIPTVQKRFSSPRVEEENTGNAVSSSQWYITTVPEVPEHLLRFRKVTVEPKVPLANERTFLAWLEWATFLAGASAAFATYSDVKDDPLTQIIGILTLPFSISVIIYALYEYAKRAKLIQRGDPANRFADRKGIMILSTVFICFFVATFLAKLHRMK